MKSKIISLLILFLSFNALASEYYWPDTSGSCDGTLNQCLALVSNGDTIYIQTNSLINESVSINKSVSLIAVDGYKPVFSSGRSIVMNAGDDLIIKGLELNKGFILVNNNNVPFFTSDMTVRIENNLINDVLGENSGIYVRRENFGAHVLNLTVKYNQVNALANDSEFNNAIKVDNFTDKLINGLIQENKIHALGDSSVAIEIVHYGIYTPISNFTIVGNHLSFESFGLRVGNYSNGGQVHTTLLSNVFKGGSTNRGTDVREGLGIASYGSFDSGVTSKTVAYIQNNTFSNLRTAVFLQANESENDFKILNNIIVKLSFVAINHRSANNSSLGDANLIYRDSSYPIDHLGYIQGAKDIVTGEAVPIGLMDSQFRLLDESQAIDYGLALESAPVNMPYIDADGLYRFKEILPESNRGNASIIDVGAFEYGDSAVTTISSDTDNYFEFSALPEFIGLENQYLNNLHVTTNAYLGPANNHNEAAYNFFGFDWAVFNQDEVNLLPGTTFNLIKIGESSRNLRHVNLSESNSTELNYFILNNNSNKILQVTQVWNNNSATDYNDHPIGVFYNSSSNKWQIQNLDSTILFSSSIPEGAEFNIYSQEPSLNAWKHQATTENVMANITLLDHQLLNGKPCAQIQVTQEVVQFGTLPIIYYNSESIAVSYDEVLQQWGIMNQSGNDMPIGAKFHVLINPQQIEQTSSCPIQSNDLIFANGFD